MQTIHSAHYLQPTALLDFDNIAIRHLLHQRVLRPRLNKHIAGIRGKHMPYMQKSFEQGFIEESALKRGRHCTPST